MAAKHFVWGLLVVSCLARPLGAQAASSDLLYPLKAAELCDEANAVLSDLREFAKPGGRTFFGGREAYEKKHRLYLAGRNRLSELRAHELLTNELGEARVEQFIQSCAKNSVSWLKLGRVLPDLKGMTEHNRLMKDVRGFGKERRAREVLEQAVVLEDLRGLLAEDAVAELTVETHYLVTISFRTQSLTLDPEKILSDLAKTQFRTILVDEKTYHSWKIGQVLDATLNSLEILLTDDGSLKVTTARVSEKRTLQEGIMRLRSGRLDRVASSQLDSAVALVKGGEVAPFESDSMGRKVYLLLSEEPRASDFVQVAPLQRYFVKLRMQNVRPFSFDLKDALGNLFDQVTFEYEVTREVYEQNDAFSPTFNGMAYLLDGSFSFAIADVVDRRTQPDEKFVAAKTKEGTVVFLAREKFQSLRP